MSDDKLKELLAREDAVLGKGLLPHTEDTRDIGYEKVCGGIFGWMTYKPKNQRLINATLTTKNQYPHNTCGWNSSGLQKEKDEGVPLSIRGLVMIGRREGKITQDGFSSLRDNQAIIQQFGMPEESYLPEDINDWEEYAKISLLTPEMLENALSHKSASYARVYGEDNILKALDDGKVLQTGLDWYRGFNMGGGFAAPWLIFAPVGSLIGGHAFAIVGYDLNYQGKKVLIAKQSLGPDWGDHGLFYIEMEYAMNNCYAFYTQTDVPVNVAKFLNDYQFKFVKGKTGGAIYQILGSEKLPFADPSSFYLYTDSSDYSLVEKERIDNSILAAIPNGDFITVRSNPNRWKQIKKLATPDRWKEVQKYLAEDKAAAATK